MKTGSDLLIVGSQASEICTYSEAGSPFLVQQVRLVQDQAKAVEWDEEEISI